MPLWLLLEPPVPPWTPAWCPSRYEGTAALLAITIITQTKWWDSPICDSPGTVTAMGLIPSHRSTGLSFLFINKLLHGALWYPNCSEGTTRFHKLNASKVHRVALHCHYCIPEQTLSCNSSRTCWAQLLLLLFWCKSAATFWSQGSLTFLYTPLQRWRQRSDFRFMLMSLRKELDLIDLHHCKTDVQGELGLQHTALSRHWWKTGLATQITA